MKFTGHIMVYRIVEVPIEAESENEAYNKMRDIAEDLESDESVVSDNEYVDHIESWVD